MSPSEILATLTAMGATVTVVGDRLRVVGVALPENFQAAIRAAKAELVQWITTDARTAHPQAEEPDRADRESPWIASGITGPWPEALAGLGSRAIIAYSPCAICGSGSWARFGETVLCLDCARVPRSLRLLRFRTALRESWRLMAASSDADPAECQRCVVEVFSLETAIGEPLATTLRRTWEDQWWTETKTCPTCGGAVRHSPETGEETAQ